MPDRTFAGDRPPRYGRVEINSLLPDLNKNQNDTDKKNETAHFFSQKKLTKFDNMRIINSSIVNLLHVVLEFQGIEGFSHFPDILI